MDGANIYIPYLQILPQLAFTVGLCFLGVLTGLIPQAKEFFQKVAKRISVFIVVFFVTMVLYTKYYSFQLLALRQWIFSPLIPWCGYVFGGLVTYLCRRPMKQVYTIGIETGFQNVGVAFLIVLFNFPSPEYDYAILPLVSISFISIVPLMIIAAVVSIVRRTKQAKSDSNQNPKEEVAADEEMQELQIGG